VAAQAVTACRPAHTGRAGGRHPGNGDTGSSENTDVFSVTRSTVSTLPLGSRVQPGWGHPELAATTASWVAR